MFFEEHDLNFPNLQQLIKNIKKQKSSVKIKLVTCLWKICDICGIIMCVAINQTKHRQNTWRDLYEEKNDQQYLETRKSCIIIGKFVFSMVKKTNFDHKGEFSL